MMIALGKDVAGKVWFADLLKMPHLLIAGSTNSGKTVCINTVLLSLLYQNTAATLRMIMVDPKRVELTMYNGIPHLLTPVITDAAKTVNALKWCIGEMDRRFTLLADSGKRDIGSYNKTAVEPLPYIVFVIDELADLMAMAASEVGSWHYPSGADGARYRHSFNCGYTKTQHGSNNRFNESQHSGPYRFFRSITY